MQLQPLVRFAGKISKHGNAISECEDSFAVGAFAFAVADGASDAIYSDVWSTILADSFCQNTSYEWEPAEYAAWLERCRSAWDVWEHQLRSTKTLPWFTTEKLRYGSYSTFVGLSFANSGTGEWQAWLYGDSCLILVRDSRIELSTPVKRSADFANTPALIGTDRGIARNEPQRIRGTAKAGDRILLATDALSAWILRECEGGRPPWVALDGLSQGEPLNTLIAQERQAGRLRNDDVTLVSIEMKGQAET